ncbi:hypothetical protein ACFOKJ_03370 [Vogesella amnigena]|uniref:DNA-binding protein n=1 Tax=Vogesella amnigena TaxID=1507449 RepID=A0ABV7TQK4_9NEIS
MVSSTRPIRDELLQFLEALGDFDGLDNDPITDYWRMQIVKNWHQGHFHIDKSIILHIENRATAIHPRLQLLPFLTRKGVLADYGKRILGAYSTPVPANISQITQGDLSISATAAALGLERGQVKHLVELSLLKKNCNPAKKIKIPVSEVEKLLRTLSVDTNTAYVPDGLPNKISTVNIIHNIQLGRALTAGYALAKGLSSLQFLGGGAHVMAPSSWLDVNQSASRLGVHQEIVRSLIKKKILPASHIKIGRFKKTCVKIDDLAYFEMNYSTTGNLAKLAGVNATNFSEKLMHIGKRPVTGPKIDGGLVYVFDKREISQDDLLLASSLQTYETVTGRKGKAVKENVAAAAGLTLNDAAKALGISRQMVLMLARKNIIQKVDTAHGKTMIEVTSIENILAMLQDPRFITLEAAASQLGETTRTFFSTWVMVDAIKVTNLSVWKFVPKESVDKILELKANYMTGKEAGIYLGIHSTHMRNLQRRGIVEPIVLKGRRTMHLYLRSDVENLKHSQVCDKRKSRAV